MKKLLHILCLGLLLLQALPLTTANAAMISGAEKFGKQEKIAEPIVKKDSKPLGYTTIKWLIGALGSSLEKVYKAFGKTSKPILLLVTSFVLIAVIYMVATGKPVPIPTIFSILVTVIILKTFIMDWEFFAQWFYYPVMNIMMELPTFIMKNSITDIPSDVNDHLLYVFQEMQKTLDEFLRIGELIASEAGWWAGKGAYFKGLLLQAVFVALTIAFTYMFIIGIFSFHVMLFLLPTAIALAAAKPTRKYLVNILNQAATFMLVPTFAAIAMAITLSLLSDLTQEAVSIGINEKNVEKMPEFFYLKAIMLGIFSIFFHLKATSFASMVIGTQDSGFGQIFGASLAMAGGAASLLKEKGKEAGAGVLKTASNNFGKGGGLKSSLQSGSLTQAASGLTTYGAIQSAKGTASGVQKGARMLFGNTPNTE